VTGRRRIEPVLPALRLGFAALLAWACADKLLHPYAFAQDVAGYRVFGPALSYAAAVFVPALELVTAVCLAAGVWLDAAALLNAGLMTAFLALVLQAFFRKLAIPCGCFSVGGDALIGPLKILENAVFAALSWVLVLRARPSGRAHGPASPRGAAPPEA
jgi:uncharacterized membrane protein YphA (DoxX/SURF4 family)